MPLTTIFKDSTPGKTVFVLGAGFSRAAGYPLQADILKNLTPSPEESFMTTPFELLSKLDRVARISTSLETFLKEVFFDVENPSLEDIFTTLDQTILDKGYCKGFDWQELVSVDNDLKSGILTSFHKALSYAPEKSLSPYRQFSSRLLRARSLGLHKYSVISLNWDSLLEDSISWCIKQAKLEGKVDIDYCCFTNPIGENSTHTPSLLQKAKGIMNLKLLKLHGSANWLICYSCKRLYTGLSSSQDVTTLYIDPKTCPRCEIHIGKKYSKIPFLKPYIITPTYLKTFPNSHIQNVWDNAQIELLEATRVVFLGYSLPEADYYVRSLFRRTIRKDAVVDVVLLGADKRFADSKQRYEAFFPSRKLTFYQSGIQGFFKSSLKESTGQNLGQIKRKLNNSRHA